MSILAAQGILAIPSGDGQVGTQVLGHHPAWTIGRVCETSQAGKRPPDILHEARTSESSVDSLPLS